MTEETITQAVSADVAHAETVIGAEAVKVETAVTTDAKAVEHDVQKATILAHLRAFGISVETDLDEAWLYLSRLAGKL